MHFIASKKKEELRLGCSISPTCLSRDPPLFQAKHFGMKGQRSQEAQWSPIGKTGPRGGSRLTTTWDYAQGPHPSLSAGPASPNAVAWGSEFLIFCLKFHLADVRLEWG